jgi:hypothetical protein
MVGEHAHFLLERFPRIPDGTGSYFEWIEIYPGVRIWWNEETYTDEELIGVCRDKEHFYALRWIESRSRRLNNGCVCELEIIPEETKRFFSENNLTMMKNEVNVQSLYSVFASFSILLIGYESQIRSIGDINYPWRFLCHEDNEEPVNVFPLGEINNDNWWGGENESQELPVDDWEKIHRYVWAAGHTMFSDESGRYAEFLEFYVLAMETADQLERNARFIRCLETILRPRAGIARSLRERVPLMTPFSSSEYLEVIGKTAEEAKVELAIIGKTVNDSWTLRSKHWHGQTLKEKHYEKLNDCLIEFPSILYYLNLGLVMLCRIPTEEELIEAESTGSLDWEAPIIWDIIGYDVIEDWTIRIDWSYRPELVEEYLALEQSGDLSYDEFLHNRIT